MSSCSAAEIAEKKRIALEKLKAKKAQLTQINATTATNNINPTALNNNVPKPTSYSQPSTTSSQPAGRVENKASSFISALKGSNIFVQRQQQQHPARDAAHPYKRPSTDGSQTSGSNNFYKKSTTDNYADKPKGSVPNMSSSTAAPQKQVAPVFVKSVTCKVAMITTNRFEVQPSSYHAKLIEVFKTIPSKSYGKLKASFIIFSCFKALFCVF